MSRLREAIRLIEQEIAVRRARCVIADEGWPGESSLLGTRDGYLNFVLALMAFVADADEGNCCASGDCQPGTGQHWDDRVKGALYQLPTRSATFLVGASLFTSHAEFMTDLSQLVDPLIGYPLLNDPEYQDPGSPATE